MSSSTPYPHLFQPGTIGPLHLPHRLLMGAMHLAFPENGNESERLIAFYQERIAGGAALVTTGGVAVLPEGRLARMPTLTDLNARRQLVALSTALHRLPGAKISLQLFHAGRYTRSQDIEATPWAPSSNASPLNPDVPHAMTAADIARLVAGYQSAAAFAREAGFDAVEVMASEGYLLNEFVAPRTNRRDDAYGGSFANRVRLLLEVMDGIKRELGSRLALVIRLSGADFVEGGSSSQEVLQLAQTLEHAGADALNIGIGWHESRLPTVASVVPRAAFAPIFQAIRQAVHIPVIGANRINTPTAADRLIREGILDFAAPARPWLADPAFARKSREQTALPIKSCVACNHCLDIVMANPPEPVECLVNPRAGNESRFPTALNTGHRQTVAVVGGGPAGCEAAVTAAALGHQVTLFEAAGAVGGQLRWAMRIPGKEEFGALLRYYETVLHDRNVQVELLHRPSVEELLTFDHVLVATGARPALPLLPGSTAARLWSYPEVFDAPPDWGTGRILILGAGGIGCDVAHYLSHPLISAKPSAPFWEQWEQPITGSRPITLASRSSRVAKSVGRTTRWIILQSLKRQGVTIVTGTPEARIPQGIALRLADGTLDNLAADHVILCTGQVPSAALVPGLEARGAPVSVVGGARSTERLTAARAIREGFLAARQLSEHQGRSWGWNRCS